jgi:hypothetical protein
MDGARDPLMERRVSTLLERLAAEGIQITLAPSADAPRVRVRHARHRA